MHWHGDDLVGTVEVLPTPAGMMLQDLVMAGMELGVQMRAYATWAKADSGPAAGERRVKSVEIVTWDFVPQHHLQQETYVVPTKRKVEGAPVGYRAQVMAARGALIKGIHAVKRWKRKALKARAASRKPMALKAKDMRLKDVWLATHQTMPL